MQGIYEIVNLADGKATAYVGSSQDIEYRWGNHRSALRGGRHDNPRLQNAWNKYGEDAFVFSVLEEVGGDMLLIIEQEYLDDYFGSGHCYNIAREAASPMKGRRHTDEAKHKISEAIAGERHPMWGKHHTEESNKKNSESCSGRVPWNVGLKLGPLSDEAKHTISEALMGREFSDEHRRNMSKAMIGNQNGLGYRQTEEHKRNAGAARAKPYPAFIHRETLKRIPASNNLSELCRARGLSRRHMWAVIHGKRPHHKGWILAYG